MIDVSRIPVNAPGAQEKWWTSFRIEFTHTRLRRHP